ncbi:MAG: hypothetical protein GF344_08965 [Chitinivibrionales bacterium]|nr:hypothetical protein [Chitinivibrionales bacterium]MBD3356990.1 hypothetical protein [Chitinivibrionales bacterium]
MGAKTAEIPNEYLNILRNYGGRVTLIVTTLLQRLHVSGRIYSPRQMKDELSETLNCNIGFPTIYRAIDRLMQCRLMHRMHRDDEQAMFFLCRHPDHEHHHHFICTICRRVFEIDMCLAHQYESHVSRDLEASVTKHIMQLEGVCKGCR